MTKSRVAQKRRGEKAAEGSGRSAAASAKASPSVKAAMVKPLDEQVQDTLRSLEQMSTKKDRDNLARFGITVTRAFGVSMAHIQKLAKQLGRSHELAAALWDTGWYEARMLTAFVDEPERVTPSQMDRWAKDFDNWGICDTLCFCLFDRTPHAWTRVAKWSTHREEFVKRAAFALLASLAGHDRSATDEKFIESLVLVERAATDDRNFVKKAVSWALRRIGRRNAALNRAAIDLARRLTESPETAARWVGREASKELTGSVVKRQLAARRARTQKR